MFLLTVSPQTLFILDTVEFILSGLVLTALVWLTWKESARREQWAGWIIAFLLLVASSGLCAWTSYRLLVEAEAAASAPLSYATSGLLETAGMATLVWAILNRFWGRWAALGPVALLLELALTFYEGPSLDYPPSLPHSISATTVSLLGFVGIAVRARREHRYVASAFVLLAVAHLSVALGGRDDFSWSLSSLLGVLGLAGFALAVERRSQDLFTQVFVRLNLIFIFLAAILMTYTSQAVANETVGAVQFAETGLSARRDIARPILVIFFAFTSAVGVASLVIGLVVYGASERLRRQVRQIEQSERQLMQAAKLASLGELVSGVAHEINNPLGVILSRTEYQRDLVSQGATAEDLSEDLEAINRQAHRISRIVQDLLRFARPHPLQLQTVRLTDVIKRSLALTAAHLREAGVRPRVEIPADLPALRADPDRLEQVLINLLNNAVDAMTGGGELRIGARVDEHQLLLSVADTGVGIPEEDLKRIFDPFFSTKHGKGSGLGLSISYAIVRDHGGQIWAESQPGQGSTFFILLPAEGRS